jgi:hypothetical protein
VFFKSVVDRRFVTSAEIKSVAKLSRYKAPIKRVLVSEVQRFLRQGLGLDLVMHTSEPVVMKKGQRPSFDLADRRNFKRMSVSARPTMDGSIASVQGTGSRIVHDTDVALARRASGGEQVKRAVCFAALCFVAQAPRQRLPEQDLMQRLEELDTAIEANLGTDWWASVKRWVREQDILVATHEKVTHHTGEQEMIVAYTIAGGGRSLIGMPAAIDMMLQVTGTARADDQTLRTWLGSERISIDRAEARHADDDEDAAEEVAASASAGAADDDGEDDDQKQEDDGVSARGKRGPGKAAAKRSGKRSR